uniref:Uncharacterized protein n=1 Tax=Ixodes ricinus TaxID=34613 RepID=A0A6B0UZD8_IXORI
MRLRARSRVRLMWLADLGGGLAGMPRFRALERRGTRSTAPGELSAGRPPGEEPSSSPASVLRSPRSHPTRGNLEPLLCLGVREMLSPSETLSLADRARCCRGNDGVVCPGRGLGHAETSSFSSRMLWALGTFLTPLLRKKDFRLLFSTAVSSMMNTFDENRGSLISSCSRDFVCLTILVPGT